MAYDRNVYINSQLLNGKFHYKNLATCCCIVLLLLLLPFHKLFSRINGILKGGGGLLVDRILTLKDKIQFSNLSI